MLLQLIRREFSTFTELSTIKSIEIDCDFDALRVADNKIDEAMLLSKIPNNWLPCSSYGIMLAVQQENGSISGITRVQRFRSWSKFVTANILLLHKVPVSQQSESDMEEALVLSNKARLDALTRKAAELDAVITHDLYDFMHLDCFWYDAGSIVEIVYRDYRICFDVCGDLIGSVNREDLPEEQWVDIHHRGGSTPLMQNCEVTSVIKNDAELKHLLSTGEVVLESNNWINICIVDNASGEYVCEPDVAASNNLLEAAEAAFGFCVSYINDLCKNRA